MERGHTRHRSEQYTSYAPPHYHSPVQRTLGDPYSYNRDIFMPQPEDSRDGQFNGARAWSGVSQGIPPSQPSILPPSNLLLPPHQVVSNVASTAMPPPQELSRRRSIGGAASPLQFAAETYNAYHPRAMPPPSPPTTAIPAHGSGAYGPSTVSPFTGIRDLANMSSSRRSGGGMSISSILGSASDERRPSTMQPPSPGRARASSMRESYNSGYRDHSPARDTATPRSATSAIDPGRAELDRTREERPANGFRTFPPAPQGGAYAVNGQPLPGRPSSQPVEYQPPALLNEMSHKSDESGQGRAVMFRSFASTDQSRESRPADSLNSWATADRSAFSSPGANKEQRDVFSPTYPSKQFSASSSEEQAALFRPAYPQPLAHESIEQKPLREFGRATPPLAYQNGFRNGYSERPLTYEEHQRFEAAGGRLELQRKDSDPRSIFNISPELRRRGRDSPLPQAVQGAQPRHIGPGGDHPGIKSEFGRMFSGLGAGVGSATPVGGQSMNGHGTPTRIVSPTRPGEGDYTGSPIGDDGPRSASARPARKQGYRRPRDDLESEKYDGRMTPSLSQRGTKRAKTAHPLHHHHHHHHHTTHHHHLVDAPEQTGSYGMIKFPSNPLLQTQATHRHHHHHHTHTHKHAGQTIPLRKPTITIRNEAVLEAAATKLRRHLGSMPYRALSLSVNDKPSSEYHIQYTSQSDLIPRFDGKENCTYTVRVPRWYVSRSAAEIEAGEHSRLEEVCRSRHLWGTDIYTDDSDVIAAAVHAGWIQGDFGYATEDLQTIDEDEDGNRADNNTTTDLDSKPKRPIKIPDARDVHITILILPTLEIYSSSHQNHVLSRDWKDAEPHDGMSYMIHSIKFVDEGRADRGIERTIASKKARMTIAAKRRMPTAHVSLPGAASVQVGA